MQAMHGMHAMHAMHAMQLEDSWFAVSLVYATAQFLRCVKINSLSVESRQNPQY